MKLFSITSEIFTFLTIVISARTLLDTKLPTRNFVGGWKRKISRHFKAEPAEVVGNLGQLALGEATPQ